jgi:hypothetical protein
MEQFSSTHWRQMFERRQEKPAGQDENAPAGIPPSVPTNGYDDGYQATQSDIAPPSLPAITEEAALALAADRQEYRPWILQRNRTRPAMMLHLRRYDPRSAFWIGWVVAYPSLVAVEYIGEAMLSLDFGMRQFMLEGRNLGELVNHLQEGTVLCVQEYAASYWPVQPASAVISKIQLVERTTP